MNELLNNENVQIVISTNDLKELAALLAAELTNNKEPQQAKPQTLSADEACRILHVKGTTLWRMGKTGDLPYTKVGAKRVYNMADVEKLLNQ